MIEGEIMTENQNRILIFGAGTIGSIYALKFLEAGFDVTMFARSNRFKTLSENGLQYDKKGTVCSIKINVIDKLDNDDIYDFIFVTVRYDQAESALLALKDNKSKTIVTMTNSSTGFSQWLDIVHDRLLPAFPGFGGQIKEEILYARIPPKAIAATMFGDVSGLKTKRVEELSTLFDTAKLSYKNNVDMESFLITHSVTDIAIIGALHVDDEIIDSKAIRTKKNAHRITITLKKYFGIIQKAGITINPPMLKSVLKFPNIILDLFFILFLRSKMVKGMLLPDFAIPAIREVKQLEKDLLEYLNHSHQI